MDMIPVSSQNLAAVGYNADSKTLFIKFHKGGTYAYDNVPESVYRGLMSASSKGKYHKAYIKNSYHYRPLG